VRDLILFLRSQQPSRPDEGVIPMEVSSGGQPPPQPPGGGAVRRRRAFPGEEEPMDIDVGPPNPPAPPGGGPPPSGTVVGHIVPDLLQTNRQILERFGEMHEENRRLINAALQLEEGRRAEREAAAVEARERHEQTMHMIRTNNPHHEVIAAMHAGVAGLHQAAQEISSSAAQHRQMAADTGQMFMTAFRQAREALEVATTSSGPPPPPGGGGGAVAIQVNVNAAMRPNEVALAGPEPSLTQPLDAVMTQPKRPVSAHSAERNTRQNTKRLAIAAAEGAARAASASNAPATHEEETPA
jgi:hypothetical protein